MKYGVPAEVPVGDEPGQARRALDGHGPPHAASQEVHLRAQDLGQHHVAFRPLRPGREVEEVGLQAQHAGSGGREPRVVGLQAPEGRDRLVALRLGLGQEVLQLARLVPAAGRAELVVALHEDRASQRAAQRGQRLQRRRVLAEHHARHGIEPSLYLVLCEKSSPAVTLWPSRSF